MKKRPRKGTARRKQVVLNAQSAAQPVTRFSPKVEKILASIEDVKRLPDDPEWDALAQKLAEHTMKRLPEPADTCGELADRLETLPLPEVNEELLETFSARRKRRSHRP